MLIFLNSNPKIALVGHLDTVPIHESQKNYSDEENIYGRGAVDMKAGVAVMIQTILDERDNVVGVLYRRRRNSRTKWT